MITGSRIALPAGCLSICINLERLAAFCETSTSQAKRRRIIFEHLMCLALPGVYIALRTSALNLLMVGTQIRATFDRPRRSTPPIRSVLWLWLSTCYLSYYRDHLSCHDPPVLADRCDVRLRWSVPSCLSRFETMRLYMPPQGLLGVISLSMASSFMERGARSPCSRVTCTSGSLGWQFWKLYHLPS